MGEAVLTIKDIDKSFAGVYTLKNACLEPKKNKVHALIGENGAGKSILMKILTGIYSKDSGAIVYEGRQVGFKSPKEAQDADIAIVHQELNMMNHLTVTQDIFTGKEKTNGKLINDRRMMEEAEKLFGLLNTGTDPREMVGRLTARCQQMCEITKVTSTDAKIIILDEPTTALTDSGASKLSKIIRDLRTRGAGIIYTSHRMDEINQITDKITVMRDGGYVGTLITKDSAKDDTVQMTVGCMVYEEPKSSNSVKSSAPMVLKVEHLNVGETAKDASFKLRKGETLGFSGLMEAGRTETARAISGADRRDSSDTYVNGKQVDIESPQSVADVRIGYLSEDRKRYGVIIEKTVAENTTMASLKAPCKGLFIDKNVEKETTEQYMGVLKTKAPSVERQIRNLSGGNQQKVVIIEWFTGNCDILIFDEPARGIDVGAKNKICTLMDDPVKQGKSTIMIPSELTEML